MRNLLKLAIIALWCWDIAFIGLSAIGYAFAVDWLCSTESALAIIPACVFAALAIAVFPKRNTLNFEREMVYVAPLRSTFARQLAPPARSIA